ncbi:hypothetical protein [Microbacterium testaceum]|uniref:hypothetical protein n=1 Tax=Microbacterium testaceum TaxID=2033 RepID=UPI001D1756E0|nr:hypothetical protein [Microbacterium testaceum]MCC4250779.1 hypothetical protein [Microbacterium testaceum]
MATELHYYGSVFALSTAYSDQHWREKLSADVDSVRDSRSGRFIALPLDDGRSVELLIDWDTRYALVSNIQFPAPSAEGHEFS